MAIHGADWTRAVFQHKPSMRRCLPYDWRTGDVDHAALPTYGITAGLMLPRSFLEAQRVSLPQVGNDPPVTLGDVCAALRDYQARISSWSPSSSHYREGSAADEPDRSLPVLRGGQSRQPLGVPPGARFLEPSLNLRLGDMLSVTVRRVRS